MSSPNQPTFYYDPMNPPPYLQYSPGTQQQFNRWEQSYQQDQQSYQQFEQQTFQQQSPFQDYRDHNQDDSDSSKHNKSVQVESEEEEKEEPVRRTGKKPIGKKAPAKRWSDEEEVALARAWLTISENPNVGNAQKRDGFYKKVTEHFHHLVKDRSRTVDQIYSKWNDMNASMKKWNGFYQQSSMNRKSGDGDEQVLKQAMKNYKILVKAKGFAHIQAWDMVRDNPLWCDIPPVGCESQSTTKRPKPNESMGSANAHIDINLDDDEDININLDRDGPRIYYEPDRPTRKGKRLAASSSSHDELIQQMAKFNSFNKEESQQRFRHREEKLRVLQEEKDARVALMRRQQQALDEQQTAVDLEFMMKDHTIYQEPMLQLILDRKREIAARWGWHCPF
ncbi:hypothetical protein R6Q59_007580 [Mikania micrantha]